MNNLFNYDSFHQLLDKYKQELPQILARHSLTQKLVPRVKLGLEQNETPFTVAVVGQMRVGKSSLLNALVGEDLAITGVNETTATINWFKYAEGERCNRFRVVWKDKPEEEFSITEIDKWIGNSELAHKASRLEFFADVPFLKHAYIVDTPGTRAVIKEHEATIQDFVTREHGNRADAIIYVFPSVARETDVELLHSFEQHSRIQNAAPYNSVAVVHKWETIDSPDPFDNVQQKVARIKQSFAPYVSDVLPVSAPMGCACEHFDTEFWQMVYDLGYQPADVLKKLFLTDQYFIREIPGCSVSIERRKMLRESYKLPWATLKFIINRVALESLSSPETLKSRISEISGIGQLREMLDKRFFSRAKMIRSFGVLAKTLPVCKEGAITLRNHKILYNKLLENIEPLISGTSGSALPAAVQDYIQETRSLIDITVAADTLEALEGLVQPVEDAFEEMNNDIKYLDQLDMFDTFEWSAEWKRKLAYLFGQFGPELENRISPFIADFTANDEESTIKALENAITELIHRQINTTGEIKEIFEHAKNRLEQLFDAMEYS